MGILTRIYNGITAFKNAFNSEVPPLYTRLNDGTHAYNYETERFGLLGILGLGQGYLKPKENLKYYYNNVYFLQNCVNLYADIASQVDIVEVDEEGNEVDNSDFVRLLKNPNVWQNGTDFIKEMTVNTLIAGISMQYGNFFKNGNLRINAQLYNLEFSNISFPEIKDRYKYKRKDISELEFKEELADSKKRTLYMYELLYFYDIGSYNGWSEKGYNSKNFFNPTSRVFAMRDALETLINTQSSMAFMSGNNVNKIVAKDNQLAGGVSPLPSDQKTDIERKLNGRGKYGAKNGKVGDVVVANEKLTALDLTRDNRKMQMIEMQDNARQIVLNAFNIPKDYYGDSTYENKQMSEARFILSNVKPILDAWLNALMAKTPLYFESRKTKLVARFDHMPSIIESRTTLLNKGFSDRADALTKVINAYNLMKVNEPNLNWEDFLNRHQFDEFLKID